MGRAVIRSVFRTWVAAFSRAATSVETSSLTEQRTTGAPCWRRLTLKRVLRLYRTSRSVTAGV
jgi:hypothetical protein